MMARHTSPQLRNLSRSATVFLEHGSLGVQVYCVHSLVEFTNLSRVGNGVCVMLHGQFLAV